MATEEILEALKQIAREKSVDRKLLVETLEAGLLSAAKKRYASAADVEVAFDELSGEIRVRVHKKVVQVAIDLAGEIDYEEAAKSQPGVRLGQTVPVDVPIVEFGRNAIQAAKQVLVQRVREAERENVFAEFIDRKGQIISGTVSQVDRGSLIVKLGKTEGIIPPREVIFRDRFKIGEPVRAILLDVDKNQKGPQLILSRTHPDFVRRLFENEVPEIFERVVEIRDIAREPGSRTKISVVSHDDRVDPVGACVGMKGARVQAIVRELGGERIDIVPWSPDPKIFLSRALSPARVLDVIPNDLDKRSTVIVADDQLSLAIGTRGQNARLASKLTGFAIDLKSQSQMEAASGEAAEIDLEDLEKDLGSRTVEKLMKAGKETLQDVMRTSVEELMAIPGIGEKTATRLLTLGGQILEDRAGGRMTTTDGGADEDEEESAESLEDSVATSEAAAGDASTDDSAQAGPSEEGSVASPDHEADDDESEPPADRESAESSAQADDDTRGGESPNAPARAEAEHKDESEAGA